ncbi:MAG: T9SS type A sorting domain-containing protein [Bacteroidota bacterium]
MKSQHQILVALCLTVAGFTSMSYGQIGEIRIPLVVRDGIGFSDTIHFGLHPSATRCIDDSLGEWRIPPDWCCFWTQDLCAYFDDFSYDDDCLRGGTMLNLRPYLNHNQADTFYVTFCAPYPVVFRWPLGLTTHFDSIKIVDVFGGALFSVNMKTTDSLLISNGSIYSFLMFAWGPSGTTAVYEEPALPAENALYQNYPNPFNGSTNIRYSVSHAEVVRIEMFDLLGRKLKSIVDGFHEQGNYSLPMELSNLPSGMYMYRMENGSNVSVRKLVLLK